jgi:hypothetical protein
MNVRECARKCLNRIFGVFEPEITFEPSKY